MSAFCYIFSLCDIKVRFPSCVECSQHLVAWCESHLVVALFERIMGKSRWWIDTLQQLAANLKLVRKVEEFGVGHLC